MHFKIKIIGTAHKHQSHTVKLQEKRLKLNDIYMSCSSPKTNLKTNF